MIKITSEQFDKALQASGARGKLRRELRWRPEDYDFFDDLELIAVDNRGGKEGVVFIELGGELYAKAYEILRNVRDPSGRAKPVVCDFCYTWQRGGNVARITFKLDEKRTLTFLCCADLKCSLHVRNLTPEARLSRAQLHEDLTTEQRKARLRTKLKSLRQALALAPIIF